MQNLTPGISYNELKKAEKRQWKSTLDNEHEIASHIRDTSPSRVNIGDIRERFAGGRATLTHLPINKVKPGPVWMNSENPKKQERYNSMDGSKAPPIVVAHGAIEDGNHRYRAAKARGDTHIPAYVVTFPKGKSPILEEAKRTKANDERFRKKLDRLFRK